jgi:hypothetical protein
MYWSHGSVAVKVLCYKPEGRGFEIRWVQWNVFNLPNPSAVALGFTQPVREMHIKSRKIIYLGSRARPVRRAANLIADFLDNVGSISQLYRPLRPDTRIALFFFYFYGNLWATTDNTCTNQCFCCLDKSDARPRDVPIIQKKKIISKDNLDLNCLVLSHSIRNSLWL